MLLGKSFGISFFSECVLVKRDRRMADANDVGKRGWGRKLVEDMREPKKRNTAS